MSLASWVCIDCSRRSRLASSLAPVPEYSSGSLHFRPILSRPVEEQSQNVQDIPPENSIFVAGQQVFSPEDSIQEYQFELDHVSDGPAAIEADQLIAQARFRGDSK